MAMAIPPQNNSWKKTLGFFLFCTGALFLTQCLARLQLLLELKLSFHEALSRGMIQGALHDLGFALVPTLIGLLLAPICSKTAKIACIFFFFWIGMFGWGNSIYFRFFEGQLEWWIVRYYWEDIFISSGSIGTLGLTPALLSGLLNLAISTLVLSFLPHHPFKRDVFKKREHVNAFTSLFGLFILLNLIPPSASQSPVGNQIFREWWKYVSGRGTSPSNQEAAKALLRYRNTPKPITEDFTRTPTKAEWPLEYRFEPNPERSREIRSELGLPKTGPIHVVLIFFESLRAYEFLHPEIGPKIFPKISAILKKHGIFFKNAYTSAASAGMTARGQFSTNCSNLPNFEGPSEHIAYAKKLNVVCIQSFLKDHGYTTSLFQSTTARYHHTGEFETAHGTDLIFDDAYFKGLGIHQEIGSLGLADKPFLQETLKKLETFDAQKKPFFASLLTISTHHPFSVIPEGPVPEDLIAKTTEHEEHRGYLSRLSYLDTAFSEFFEKFLASKLSDRTVIFFTGDHGVKTPPYEPVNEIQVRELRTRVFMGILTKKMKKPRRISKLVHQIDIVPTIATLVEKTGKVGWMGRSLFEDPGSTWISSINGMIAYRTPEKACYHLNSDLNVHCFPNEKDGVEFDPLLNSFTPEIREDVDETNRYRSLVRSTMKLVKENRFLPSR